VEEAALPSLPGLAVLKTSGFGVKLEVETERLPIEEAVSRLMAVLPIADLTVEDPPMEEIIAELYQERRSAPPEVRP
jgi:ABC-2 type transport system ATP-binding protein